MITKRKNTNIRSPWASFSARAMVALLLFITSLAWTDIASAGSERDLDSVLAGVRDAMGYESMMKTWEHGIYAEGVGEALGLETTFRMCFLPNGMYCTESLSELPMKELFDGKRGCLVDYTGMPNPLEHTPLEQSKVVNWVLGGYWLSPSCPLSKRLEPPREEGNYIPVSLWFPDGVLRATLLIDPQTNLPSGLEWRTFGQENHVEFGEYKEVDGFPFPRQLSLLLEGERTEIQVRRVGHAPEGSEKACRPMTSLPPDTKFLADVSRSVELKKAPSGNIIVNPRVNGQDVGWFLLDTGAGRNVIDKSVANSLGMPKIGEFSAAGVGGIVKVHFRKGEKLTLGPVEMREPYFVEVDFAPLAGAFGFEIGGILGYDFLARCLVELDIEKSILLIHEPGAWRDRKAPWEEIIFNRNAPAVYCSYNGEHTDLFILDTGAIGTVAFNRHVADKHDIFKGQEVGRGTTAGVGGTLEILTGELQWFELGAHRFEGPPVVLAGEAQGAFSDEGIAGIVGLEFLSSFKLLIDYPEKRVAFIESEEE